MSSRPILVMAGGTGGHVYPALAVAQALQQRSRTVVWLGSYRGLESRIVPANNIDMEQVSVRGLRGKHGLTLLLAPLNLIWAFGNAFWFFGTSLANQPSGKWEAIQRDDFKSSLSTRLSTLPRTAGSLDCRPGAGQ